MGYKGKGREFELVLKTTVLSVLHVYNIGASEARSSTRRKEEGGK